MSQTLYYSKHDEAVQARESWFLPARRAEKRFPGRGSFLAQYRGGYGSIVNSDTWHSESCE